MRSEGRAGPQAKKTIWLARVAGQTSSNTSGVCVCAWGVYMVARGHMHHKRPSKRPGTTHHTPRTPHIVSVQLRTPQQASIDALPGNHNRTPDTHTHTPEASSGRLSNRTCLQWSRTRTLLAMIDGSMKNDSSIRPGCQSGTAGRRLRQTGKSGKGCEPNLKLARSGGRTQREGNAARAGRVRASRRE